jgi:hypothetical protein
VENTLRLKSSSEKVEDRDIALKYMVFLTSDGDRLQTFCALSGLGEGEIKERLIEPQFQGFLLDYLLQNESERGKRFTARKHPACAL